MMLVNTSLTASVLVTERYCVRYSKYFISITVMKKLKRAGASIEDLKITISSGICLSGLALEPDKGTNQNTRNVQRRASRSAIKTFSTKKLAIRSIHHSWQRDVLTFAQCYLHKLSETRCMCFTIWWLSPKRDVQMTGRLRSTKTYPSLRKD